MAHPKAFLIVSLIIIVAGISAKAEPVTSNVITFDEFPEGTSITDQYSYMGIIFGGDDPCITEDVGNPNSPVLAGTPKFYGAIEGRFVNFVNVTSFSFDAGYFNDTNTTQIEWFDWNNNRLGVRENNDIGFLHFNIDGNNICRWRISIIDPNIKPELYGFAIDNVQFTSDGRLNLTKTDDVDDGDCVKEGRTITYTITYDVNSFSDCNLVIIDYLPAEVNYISSTPEGDYNALDRTVSWNLKTLNLPACGSLTLSGIVNSHVSPSNDTVNIAKLKVNSFFFGYAKVSTPVCYWSGNIIYVDRDANGLNNGTSWDDAFTDFNVALTQRRVMSETGAIAKYGLQPDRITQHANLVIILTQHSRCLTVILQSGGISGASAFMRQAPTSGTLIILLMRRFFRWSRRLGRFMKRQFRLLHAII